MKTNTSTKSLKYQIEILFELSKSMRSKKGLNRLNKNDRADFEDLCDLIEIVHNEKNKIGF